MSKDTAIGRGMRTRRLIRRFLALPAEAAPMARWEDPQDDWPALPYLREALRRPEHQHMYRTGVVVLSADKNFWRGGVRIDLRDCQGEALP